MFIKQTHHMNDHDGFFGAKFRHGWYGWNNDGVGFDIHNRVETNKKRYDKSLNQEGSGEFQILNLCINSVGYRDDLCNCDKDIFYKGAYSNFVQTASDFNTNTLWNESGMSLALTNAYYIYTAELDVNSTNFLSFDSISNGLWSYSLAQNTNIDLSQLGDAVGALGSALFSNDAGISGIFSSLGEFAGSIDSVRTVNDTNSNFQFTYVRPFNDVIKLRANIPRVFRVFNTVALTNKTTGKKRNNSETWFKSIFYWSFKIPTNENGFDINGNIHSQFEPECCNEFTGFWQFHGKEFEGALNNEGDLMKTAAQNFLNYHPTGGAPIEWDQSRYSNDPNLLISPGFVDLTNNSALLFPKGGVYTVSRCNCETFLRIIEDPITGTQSVDFLNPDFNLPFDELCQGSPVTLWINNIEELDESCQVAELRLDGNLIFSGITSTVDLTATGTYTLSFVDTCTGCSVSRQFTVNPCPPIDDDFDCIKSQMSVFPVPLEGDNNDLNFKICLEECADTSSIQNVNNWASIYFPAQVTITDLNNNAIIGPVTIFDPVSVDNDFCLSDIIDLTASPQWPFPSNSTFVVAIQLNNGQLFTRTISVN